MSDKTIAEVLTAKMKYEGEIEKFLREKVIKFTEETGVQVKVITVIIPGLDMDFTGRRHYKVSEIEFGLDWEGVDNAPIP